MPTLTNTERNILPGERAASNFMQKALRHPLQTSKGDEINGIICGAGFMSGLFLKLIMKKEIFVFAALFCAEKGILMLCVKKSRDYHEK